ncbi:Elongation factor Ts [Zancudomyces culisetae]|nr:Elongation factor Ts [Zancudomyces culisetae]|eukprot:OMH84110.1 Elongation factor Ts [Zancudomyces culisetae]
MGAKRAEKIKDRAVGASVITTFIDQSRGLGAIIKISCETDFVSRNETFQQLATRVCEVAAGISSKQLEKVNVEQVLESELPEEGLKVKELIQQNIGKLGENIVLKDAAGINLGIEGEESHKKAIAGYVHGASVPGGTSGKIASLLVLNVDSESKAATNNPEFTKFSKRLAQQVVGYKPLFIQEKEFQEAQSKVVTSSSGECSQIFSNPLDKQTVLLNQEYMFGGEGISTVEDALSLSGKAQNISLAIDSVAWFDSES